MSDVELRLVDGFELRAAGDPVELPLSAQRLVAFLAFQERPLQRVYVAGTLWLDTLEERALGSLRSALWRVRRTGIPLLHTPDTRLALDAGVRVDVVEAARLARRLLGDAGDLDPATVDLAPLTGEILPDWYDDWLVLEREQHRQLRLHALEALAARLGAAGRYGEAVDAAIAVIAGEPLRESAHRTLIGVHLLEGNASEARRHAALYSRLHTSRLGEGPPTPLDQLVATETVPR